MEEPIENNEEIEIRDAPGEFLPSKQAYIDGRALEAYIRSAMKPILNNADDENTEDPENKVDLDRLPFECIKRLYAQDFYRCLLESDYLYNAIDCQNEDKTFNDGNTLTTNYVSILAKSADENFPEYFPPNIANLINNKLKEKLGVGSNGRPKSVTMERSWFHSTIETMREDDRQAGLYDSDELISFNKTFSATDEDGIGLYELADLEEIITQEAAMFKEDALRENKLLNFRPLARRITETFARLSNTRLSALFYTKDQKQFSKAEAVAALDIFYNLMSRISEANRVHLDDFVITSPPVKPPYPPPPPPVEPEKIKARILFCLDSTNSMSPILSSVASKAGGAIKTILEGNPSCQMAVYNPWKDRKDKNNKKIPDNWPGWTKWVDKSEYKYLADYLKDEVANWRPNHNMEQAWAYNQPSTGIKWNGTSNNESWHAMTSLPSSDKWNENLNTGEKVGIKVIVAVSDEPADNYTSISAINTDPKNYKKEVWTGSKWVQNNEYYQFNNMPASGDWWYGSYGAGNKTCYHRTTDQVVKEFVDNNTILYHVFVRSELGYDDVCKKYIARIKSKLIDKIPGSYQQQYWNVDDFDGGFFRNLEARIQQANATAQQAANDQYNAAVAEWNRQKKKIDDDYNEQLSTWTNGFAGTIYKLTRASYHNRVLMDILRPSVFCWGLVNVMSQWYYANKHDSVTWGKIRDEVVEKAAYGDNVYPWFSRSKDQSHNYLNVKNTDPFSHFKIDDIYKGYSSSLTGLHLDLLDSSCFPDGNKPDNYSPLLEQALLSLIDAFGECFHDPEVLKLYDTSTGTATNLWKLIQEHGGTNTSQYTAPRAPNLGELPYAIMLERIIEKVFKYFNVKSSSFFDNARPNMSMDLGLRFFTDRCLDEKNLVRYNPTKVHDSYSRLDDYIEKVKSLLNSDVEIEGITAQDRAFTKKVLDDIVSKDPYNQDLYNWSLCPWRKRYDGEADQANPNTPIVEFSQVMTNVPEDKVVVGDKTELRETDYQKRKQCKFAVHYHAAPVGDATDGKVEESGTRNIETVPVTDGCEAQTKFNALLKAKPDRNDYDTQSEYEAALQSFIETNRTLMQNLLKEIPPVCPAYVHIKDYMKRVFDVSEQPHLKKVDAENYLHTLFKAAANGELNYVTKLGSSEYVQGTEDYKTEQGDSLGYNDQPSTADGTSHNYPEQQHSPIQLAFLDHVVHFMQTLYRVNNYIAYHEPYIRVEVKDTVAYEYGDEVNGTYEPMSIYRFSNFHAKNTYKQKDNELKLKFYGAIPKNSYRALDAINRDLCYDTLDRTRHSKWRDWFKEAEVTTGRVTSGVPQKSDVGHLYRIKELPEMASVNSSLETTIETYEVVVKRFRPIFLVNAEEVFKTDEPVKKNGAELIPVRGWNITPHKYIVHSDFTHDNIIVPMNINAHNSPRCRWFHELDYAYHEGDWNSSHTKFKSGYYDPATDEIAMSAEDMTIKELANFVYYFYREWLFPVSYLHNGAVTPPNEVLSRMSDKYLAVYNERPNSDGLNRYTKGEKGNIEMKVPSKEVKLSISATNLEKFDTLTGKLTFADAYKEALHANWLYITTDPGETGMPPSQCERVFPWVMWHSARGNVGEGPSMFCYGIAHVDEGHESSFSQDGTYGMIMHAVDRLCSLDPLQYKDGTKFLPEDAFKGAYDPVSCGTRNGWHIHGNRSYGVDNNGTDGKKNYDRYYCPVTVEGGEAFRSGSDKFKDNETNSNVYKFGGYFGTGGDGEEGLNSEGENMLRRAMSYPMTWSLWNVVRFSLWYAHKEKDLDYNPLDDDSVDRHAEEPDISNEELEDRTYKCMIGMYQEWYNRFTNNGYYTSDVRSGARWGGSWPHAETDADPQTWAEAQTIGKNTSSCMVAGRRCFYEWTNVMAAISIVYNEISDTHNSMMTMYVGGHPEKHWVENYGKTTYASADSGTGDAGKAGTWGEEFKGWPEVRQYNSNRVGSGALSTSLSCFGTDGHRKFNIDRPFRYALPQVDMCRNIEAFNYHGYNSSLPTHAFKDGNNTESGQYLYQPRSMFPSNLILSATIKTKNGESVSGITDDPVNISCDEKTISSVYPGGNEGGDTEGWDMTTMNRRLVPIYPCWDILHDEHGMPYDPSSLSPEDLKRVVFAIAPHTYWDELYWGNGPTDKDDKKKKEAGEVEEVEGNEVEVRDGVEPRAKKKQKVRAQMGERIMGFCIEQFFTGEKAKALADGTSTEIVDALRSSGFLFTTQTVDHFESWPPGQKPWGQALADPVNHTDAYLYPP